MAERLPAKQALFYALPGFALAIPIIPVFTFLPTLYARDLGLGLAATGWVLLLARCADFVIDPLIGLVSDRLRSRFGRRRPLILVGGALAGVALVELFAPPAGAGVRHLAIWLVLLYLGWTAVQVPYTAWGAELVGDYDERTRLTGLREGLTLVGILTAGAVPVVAALAGLTEAGGLAAIAWLAIACGGPALALLLWGVPDAAAPGEAAAPIDLRPMLANKPFLRLFAAWFVNGLATGIPAVLFPLYLADALGADQTMRGVATLLYFAAGCAGIPLWLWLSRRFGKHRIWCGAMLLAIAAFVWVPLLGRGDIGWFLVICLATGAALGADLALPPAMQADVVDLDRLRTGESRAGFYFAIWGMTTKLALGCAAGLAFFIIDVAGFQPGGHNTPAALAVLAATYALLPALLKLVAVAMVWNYPLTPARAGIIRRRLDRRDAGQRFVMRRTIAK